MLSLYTSIQNTYTYRQVRILSADAVLEDIKRHINAAESTDYIMPIWLPFLPLILVIIGIIAAVASYEASFEAGVTAGAGTAIGVAILGVIINFYVIYKWIKRRNEHFKRTHALWSSVVAALEAAGIDEPEIIGIKDALNEAKYDEQEKSAGLWTILTIVPLVIYYVYHFLNKDFVKHERREMRILNNLRDLLRKRGGYVEVPVEPTIKDRSTFLYFILSIITFGIFQLYWVYTLTKDPNEHFRMHRVVEEKLLDSLRRVIAA